MKMLLSILLAISLCFADGTNICLADGAWIKGIAQDVNDGDTFNLIVAGQIIKVRIYGADSPEYRSNSPKLTQPYGKEAGDALRTLIDGKEIRVKLTGDCNFNRLVGEPCLGDSLNVSLWMIKNGYAWWSKKHSENRIDFREAEEEAKSKKLGLWTDNNPIAPWNFSSRIKKKNGSKESEKKKSKKN